MLTQSEKINLNYAAQVVELRSPEAHPNADRLVGWRMQDGLVYTDNTYKEGEICVFFPLECQIDSTLIAGLSLFRDKTLNKNDSVGFFDEKARVKPLRLRKEPSMGFLLRISEIEKIYGRFDYTVGELFDTVNNNLICKKHIIKHQQGPAGPKTKKVKDKEIVDGQFNFHYDTHKLALHKDILTEDEICVISKKIHGCQFTSSKVLINRRLSIFEKALKWFGFKIKEQEYEYVYSSRKVIKAIGESAKKVNHYYDDDIWAIAHNRVKDFLHDGLTVYGEIVGYTPSGSYIQKDYDYGCQPKECKIFIYRITSTSPCGHVFEWDWLSIQNWCRKNNLNIVPVLYYGHINFSFEDLVDKYLEKDCDMCANNVPDEGICIRNESRNKIAFKLKSFRFFEKEGCATQPDIESIESES